MKAQTKQRWWLAGAGWSLGALTTSLVASGLGSHAADSSENLVINAMATHRHLLYWAAGLMGAVGWIDSAILYWRGRESRQR